MLCFLKDSASAKTTTNADQRPSNAGPKKEPPHYVISHEGDYLLVFHMQSVNADGPFNAEIQVRNGILICIE